MPLPLDEVQAVMRRALLDGETGALVPLIEGRELAETQLAIYRNNVFASLTEVLRGTFPAICRLVDDRFFAYAAHEFIRRHPPQRPCLAEYGAEFADFLAGFPPCRELPYIADVARLEWFLNAAVTAGDTAPLTPSALAAIAPEEAPRVVLRFDPSLGFLASPWPIDRIWEANRPGGDDGAAIELAAGGVHLEIRRRDGAVVFQSLDRATFAFRQALGEGETLETASARALGVNAEFDLTGAFSDLFREAVVTGFEIAEVPSL
ncbi:MAG TPA: DNA-binding domain-containing protein [Stellaceae bacterium]|nr:DNA-binding domain-containing protein [Stellaceae bacterium]